MKTLNIKLSDKDMIKYGINSQDILFDELIDKIKNVVTIDGLMKCQLLAKNAGLSIISIHEINEEVASVRNAKGNS